MATETTPEVRLEVPLAVDKASLTIQSITPEAFASRVLGREVNLEEKLEGEELTAVIRAVQESAFTFAGALHEYTSAAFLNNLQTFFRFMTTICPGCSEGVDITGEAFEKTGFEINHERVAALIGEDMAEAAETMLAVKDILQTALNELEADEEA